MTDEGHYESVHVHFDDLDVMGLLHNSRYALLVERAIGAYWTRLGWSPDPATSAFKDVSFAVREFKISYEAPVMGAGELAVRLWIERMGRSSVVYGFLVLSPDHEITHAEGYRANVNLDPVTFRPTPISDESRAAAGPLFLPVAAG
ncbi:MULTISPECIES: acyl-CoA thioesterase [Nonomuraea]|uniref:Acyl-CoA thioesterase n=2 Tax=Nonomuraea TaxID=83681 RepID=A0ABW1BQS0_9ACTN|nr:MULTISPECIES: hotdog domain-containing protein [Nonomuraea]MDA0642377.1 acyl-CoA thioesterase [Nonomuraea ferruginea]TXK36080.1 acyl-CoA thioesterase [Nonomuraea sp. C10]